MNIIRHFSTLGIQDVPLVGGKNASLGEMYSKLTPKGVAIPEGFAVTADAYREFLRENELTEPLHSLISTLDTRDFHNLAEVGSSIRSLFLSAKLPETLTSAISKAYDLLLENNPGPHSVAVRSSATAEDLPNASFAGQQETYLNVSGTENLIQACLRCYASLFTDRAIKYRTDNGFDHDKVALSIGIQLMVRSDLASSGVMFSLDPDSGFEQIVVISGAWGLGENVVQGTVNTDEFIVFKPMIDKVKQPIIAHKTGSKLKTMVYTEKSLREITKPEEAIINQDTTPEKSKQLTLSDPEIIKLAKWAIIIEEHYGRHMDMEWAKDGLTDELYIVQARPETVHNNHKNLIFKTYKLLEKGQKICSGAAIGQKIVSGRAKILHSPKEIDLIEPGDILVTERTDPDWDPIMQKAAAIVTDQGGRTSHAAIVAREVGATAVVGTGNATSTIQNGQLITVATASGDTGIVYDGQLNWQETEIDTTKIPETTTKRMLILAHPDEAFRYSFLPNDGVGLLRMEFIVSNSIGIHPMALKKYDTIQDPEVKTEIAAKTSQYAVKEDYFVEKLAESVAKIAAAFYPKDVIVRMSDFKTNEYANLVGGNQFEPEEANPMIGFRGASRYYHPQYQEAFELECLAMKKVRNEMGLTNVKLMIPFCRTIDEAQKVLNVMEKTGLKRGDNNLEIYVMIEIPSNAILAEEFAHYFDGFSIGSNDLTQLTLGADRDSELLKDIFSPFDPAVMELIKMTLQKAQKTKTHTGLCGQAPSDFPEYAQFLVTNGIDSISFNPDALWKGIENIKQAELRK